MKDSETKGRGGCLLPTLFSPAHLAKRRSSLNQSDMQTQVGDDSPGKQRGNPSKALPSVAQEARNNEAVKTEKAGEGKPRTMPALNHGHVYFRVRCSNCEHTRAPHGLLLDGLRGLVSFKIIKLTHWTTVTTLMTITKSILKKQNKSTSELVTTFCYLVFFKTN